MTCMDLVRLEEKIIKALEFDLQRTSSLHFLERYQRLFGLDQLLTDKHAYLVDASATYLCRFMLKDVQFLTYKQSEIAAAAFMLALNANLDTPLSKALDVEILDKEKISVESCFQETAIRIRISGQDHQIDEQSNRSHDEKSSKTREDPLFMWTKTIENLTKLRKDKQVRRVYKALLSSLDKKEFNGKLLSGKTADLIVPRSCSGLLKRR